MCLSNQQLKNSFERWIEDEDYEEARVNAFDEEFREFLKDYENDIIDPDDVQGFLDSFTFQSEDEWYNEKWIEYSSGYADYCYEQEKDRRLDYDKKIPK